MDQEPHQMGQRLLREPVRPRVGADEEPRRCAPVDAQGPRREGHRARRTRSLPAPRPDDDHGRHGHAHGPGLREDLAPLHGEPEGACRRLRPRLVQADAPRHGPAHPLPGPAGAEGGADLAGPDPRRGSRARRREGHCGPEGQDPRVRPVHLPAGDDRLGVGRDVPRQRQARRRQRCAHPPRTPEGLGSQPARRAGEGSDRSWKRSRRSSTARSPAARRSRWPT